MIKPPALEEEILRAEELRKMDSYWRAILYLCAGMIFLKDNPLLKSFGLRRQSERLSRLSHSRSFLGQARRLGRSYEHTVYGRTNGRAGGGFGSCPNIANRRMKFAPPQLRRLGKVATLESENKNSMTTTK
jgi:hypothetical protein